MDIHQLDSGSMSYGGSSPRPHQGTIVAGAESWFPQEYRLEEAVTVGQVAFIPCRIPLPVGPVDALTASVPYSVLELALSLTFQHRPQDAIGWLGLSPVAST